MRIERVTALAECTAHPSKHVRAPLPPHHPCQPTATSSARRQQALLGCTPMPIRMHCAQLGLIQAVSMPTGATNANRRGRSSL